MNATSQIIPYEGVKLAPPIARIRLIAVEQRSPPYEPHYWYTTHVTPAPVSISTSALVTVRVSFKRKPYIIYRRHSDFVEFRQRLRSMLDNRRPRILLELPELNMDDQTIDATQAAGSGGHRGLDELDGFLKRILQLPGQLLSNKTVAEFFGIWKSDIEYKLSNNLADPFALTMAGRTIPADRKCTENEKLSLTAAMAQAFNLADSASPKSSPPFQKKGKLSAIRPALRRAKTAFLRGTKKHERAGCSSESEGEMQVGLDAIDGNERLSTALTRPPAFAKVFSSTDGVVMRRNHTVNVAMQETPLTIDGAFSSAYDRRASSDSNISGLDVIELANIPTVIQPPPRNQIANRINSRMLRQQRTLPNLLNESSGSSSPQCSPQGSPETPVREIVAFNPQSRLRKRTDSDAPALQPENDRRSEDINAEQLVKIHTSLMSENERRAVRQNSLAKLRMGVQRKQSMTSPIASLSDDEFTSVRRQEQPLLKSVLSSEGLKRPKRRLPRAPQQTADSASSERRAEVRKSKSIPCIFDYSLESVLSNDTTDYLALQRANALSNATKDELGTNKDQSSIVPPLRHKQTVSIRKESDSKNLIDVRIVVGKEQVKMNIDRRIGWNDLLERIADKFQQSGHQKEIYCDKVLVYRDEHGNVVRIEGDFELKVVLLGCSKSMTFFYV